MWQRKQTVFLLLAAVVLVVALCLPVATVEPNGMGVSPVLYNMALVMPDHSIRFATCVMGVVEAIAAALVVITIFLYKRRPLQARLCNVVCLLEGVWYVMLVAFATTMLSDLGTVHVSWTASLPLVVVILCLMARSGIRADEKLVRSMDRIR